MKIPPDSRHGLALARLGLARDVKDVLIVRNYHSDMVDFCDKADARINEMVRCRETDVLSCREYLRYLYYVTDQNLLAYSVRGISGVFLATIENAQTIKECWDAFRQIFGRWPMEMIDSLHVLHQVDYTSAYAKIKNPEGLPTPVELQQAFLIKAFALTRISGGFEIVLGYLSECLLATQEWFRSVVCDALQRPT